MIVPILKEKQGTYFTLNTLHSVSGLANNVIVKTASAYPDLIRKSLIKDRQGEPLYTYNAPLSGFSDAWNAIRQTAFLKT